MIKLKRKQFMEWLQVYGKASQENDARASSELFTQDALYFETPFDEPITGREAIYQYWFKGAQTLKDKESSYQILSVKDNVGIARWQSQFTVIDSGKRHALDCLFLVEFDENGLCCVFREWWHLNSLDTIRANESHENR